VAGLVSDGTVPPFSLEYEFDEPLDPGEESLEAARDAYARGATRMIMLAAAFTPEFDKPETALTGLIALTDAWGVDLGRRLLKTSSVPMGLKMAAARELIDLGIFKLGEEVPILHEGRPSAIAFKTMPLLCDSDPDLDRQVAEAIRLRDSGRRDEACRLLAGMQERGIAYAPAMATLAGLWLQIGNRERAREYARRIDPTGQPPDFQQTVARLKVTLWEPGFITHPPSADEMADAMREEAEDRPIRLDVTLRVALRAMPVQWLNAAAAANGTPPARLRKDREKALAEALIAPGRLAALQPESQAALRFLLESGGWAKVQALTRRFGAMDGDGFFWDEKPPTSPVGRLRELGLVFVGRGRIDGRNYKVAVVPVDLRVALGEALEPT
jgi:hypothetical protein